jgi:hypothetical protein
MFLPPTLELINCDLYSLLYLDCPKCSLRKSLYAGSYVLLLYLHCSLSIFLPLGKIRCSRSTLYLELAIFPRSLVPIIGKIAFSN